MAEFETQTELQVAVDQRSLRSARQEIESELGDVTVGVESSADTRAMRSDGGGFGGAVGSDVADLQADQVDLLEDIEQHLDGMAGMGGGGGGGGLPSVFAAPTGGGGGGLMSRLFTAASVGTGLFAGANIFGESVFGKGPGLGGMPQFLAGGGLGGALVGSLLADIGDFVSNPPTPPEMDSQSPRSPNRPDFGGGQGGVPDFIGKFTSIQQKFFGQTPGWVKQLNQTAQRLQALQPPGPANVAQDPSNFGQPEEGPLGPGSSGRQGQAGQAGRGNTQPVQGQFDVNISVEDRRDIDQEMRKIEERLRDALRGNGGGRF